jgi:hypothetical protein
MPKAGSRPHLFQRVKGRPCRHLFCHQLLDQKLPLLRFVARRHCSAAPAGGVRGGQLHASCHEPAQHVRLAPQDFPPLLGQAPQPVAVRCQGRLRLRCWIASHMA